MKRIMRYLAFVCFLLTSAYCSAQTGYNFKFKVTGWKDTTVYLGHYYGESTYIKDTARVSAAGEFVFDNKKTLDQGVYFLVLNKNKIFEFLVGSNQRFTLDTKEEDYIKNMKTSDPDNKLFFENMLFNMERHKEAEPLLKVLQDSTLTEDQKKDARANFNKINDKVMAYQAEIIAKHPKTLTATIFKSNTAVKIPDAPKKADGSIDSTFQLRWYREHFFDNFDLSNDALIRMPRPVYREKLKEYTTKLFVPQADSVIKAVDKVIALAKTNKETYKYSVFVFIQEYQQPEIMGLDAVFVHLYDKYFVTGEMDYWATSLKKTLKEHAERLRKSMIGKVGPNLIMQDANFKPRSMYDIKNKYTILYIFDPDCGHCKVETPKLADFYKQNKAKFDIEVYAVSTDTSMAKMREYMKKMDMKWITVNGPRTYVGPHSDLYDSPTTPTLYILDDKKKIIAKKVPAESLAEFFTNYEKFLKARAANQAKPKTPSKT
ncbi:TlpA family protein disulfide reductase [Fulvivirgaceae bacterium PWU5]|uniref:TlpA family protein disulfide reductase n=1 Tax=Dawidia cretensis TaxID=2782350 RepID=A0AAP2E1R4_9BACT|nr:redoxin domain-containing protein [Dawidia cretensis]MBT1710057.1 TlpA family protein disulfide reductase [Dawidia cretensis]